MDMDELAEVVVRDSHEVQYPQTWPQFVSKAYRRLQELGYSVEYKYMTRIASKAWHGRNKPARSAKRETVSKKLDRIEMLVRELISVERPTELVRKIDQNADEMSSQMIEEKPELDDSDIDDLLSELYDSASGLEIEDGAGGFIPASVLVPIAASLASSLGKHLLDKYSGGAMKKAKRAKKSKKTKKAKKEDTPPAKPKAKSPFMKKSVAI